MFILTMADGRKGEGLSAGVVCWDKFSEWVKGIVGGVWSVGSSLASGSKELSTAFGLSGQVWRVGQGDCRRVWSVGAKMLRGSKGIVGACGLSARKGRVGQEDCRWRVVCRHENGE